MIVFSSPPNIPENLVEFGCILSKLDDLACNNISKWQLSLHHILHTKWSDWQSTRLNSTKFSEMLGEEEKMLQKFYTHILKINKRLFPGSGETDCSARLLFVGCGLGRHNLTFMLKRVNGKVISGITCMIWEQIKFVSDVLQMSRKSQCSVSLFSLLYLLLFVSFSPQMYS